MATVEKKKYLVDSKYSSETVASLKKNPLGRSMFECARFASDSQIAFGERVSAVVEQLRKADMLIETGDSYRCTWENYVLIQRLYMNWDGYQRAMPGYEKRDKVAKFDNVLEKAWSRILHRLVHGHNIVFDVKPVSETDGAEQTRKSRNKAREALMPTIDATAIEHDCDQFRACGYIMATMVTNSVKWKKVAKVQAAILKGVVEADKTDNPDGTIKMRIADIKKDVGEYNHLKLAAFERWHIDSGIYGELPEAKEPEAKEPEAKEPEAKEPEAK